MRLELMYGRVFEASGSVVFACCEKELLGKVLEQGEISLKVEEAFYREKEVSEKELEGLLEEADNINLVGEKPVSVALRKGYINESNIIRIDGIPHVQIYKI